jgi:hypothetical protein
MRLGTEKKNYWRGEVWTQRTENGKVDRVLRMC